MMRKRWVVSLLACVSIVLPSLAQEGHPLVGTWHGEWGTSPTLPRFAGISPERGVTGM
jgi:hypothetical protein